MGTVVERAAQPPERTREVARPVLPPADRKGPAAHRADASCCRCAACSRCSASTRPRRPCSACARTSTSLLADESTADEIRAFDSLGNNLGALGFLIDMLGYQPALAKRLFVFDAELGELKPLMGRQGSDAGSTEAARRCRSPPASARSPATGAGAERRGSRRADRRQAGRARRAGRTQQAAPSPIEEFSRATASWTAKITGPAPLEGVLPDTEVTELEEDDLQNIFLDEAREVLHNGLAAVSALGARPDDDGELTVLRRAFHTLKGSSRMVGLMDFGEAAWSLRAGAQHLAGRPASGDARTARRHAHGAARFRQVGRGHRRGRTARLAVGTVPQPGGGAAHRRAAGGAGARGRRRRAGRGRAPHRRRVAGRARRPPPPEHRCRCPSCRTCPTSTLEPLRRLELPREPPAERAADPRRPPNARHCCEHCAGRRPSVQSRHRTFPRPTFSTSTRKPSRADEPAGSGELDDIDFLETVAYLARAVRAPRWRSSEMPSAAAASSGPECDARRWCAAQ